MATTKGTNLIAKGKKQHKQEMGQKEEQLRSQEEEEEEKEGLFKANARRRKVLEGLFMVEWQGMRRWCGQSLRPE